MFMDVEVGSDPEASLSYGLGGLADGAMIPKIATYHQLSTPILESPEKKQEICLDQPEKTTPQVKHKNIALRQLATNS